MRFTVMTPSDQQIHFVEAMYDGFFGHDIIGDGTHPLKKAFELYCGMMKDAEDDDDEMERRKNEDEDEDEDDEDEDEDEDDEDEEKWIVMCSKPTFGADKKIDGTIVKNTYTFDNYSDAKQEFDNCVKAEETEERYVEIELALESEDNLEGLEIWFCDDFDELEESDNEDEDSDEDEDSEDENEDSDDEN
jgi:hypothetical protein